ncbi:MAG: 2-oxoacid:ferredoxin oxidoreductase subunit beta [Pseudomonadota bacterium]
MTYIRPIFRHPERPKNDLGYTRAEYEGGLSTLCAGCGHDSVNSAIVQACFESNVEPHKVAKMSGIGCSSKSPAYFLRNSSGFNTVHGRMPSVTTGANMANRELIYIAVSGDGDSASIGIGQFAHVVRKNLNMVYIVMNNGCYGLTKGQDSATSDVGSTSNKGQPNLYEPIDLVSTALQLGASFVARSFSGDKAQLIPLIKAAIAHHGFALIDAISPCVTFNNTGQSTKSYDFVRAHNEALNAVDFIDEKEAITAYYKPGHSEEIPLHDGSIIKLTKLNREHDVTDRIAAITAVENSKNKGEILTGLLFHDSQSQDTHSMIGTSEEPLNSLSQSELCPGMKVLEEINDSFR